MLIGSGAALGYAYVARFLAIAAGSIESGYSRIPRSFDQAARSLGRTVGGTFRAVHLPLSKTALAAADARLASQAEQIAQQAERQTATDIEVAKLRAERDGDTSYIEALIAHIWARKGPPPPERLPLPTTIPEGHA